jgi:hypothetical protein
MLSSKRLRAAVAKIALVLIPMPTVKLPIEFSIDVRIEFHSTLKFNSTAGSRPRSDGRSAEEATARSVTTAVPHAATSACAPLSRSTQIGSSSGVVQVSGRTCSF